MSANLNKKSLETIETVLQNVFDATFTLYFKTHSYHWNITGKGYYSLHTMLGEQYESLWESIDEIAERFRAVGLAAPSTLKSTIALPIDTNQDTMLADILKDHEALIGVLRNGISTLSDAGDEAGADYLTGRLAEHEKTAWMLRSSI